VRGGAHGALIGFVVLTAGADALPVAATWPHALT
jgi:hypothetical protein